MEGSLKRQKPKEKLILRSVPTSIPRHVTSLVFCNCGLTFIPDVLFKCTWLKKIDLSWNRLTELPDAVGNWTSLESISLWGNQLTELPETVGDWVSLRWISLLKNQLTKLPEAVRSWTSLKEIVLYDNQLTKLPEAVGKWTSLEFIYLDGNQLVKLPDTVGNWISLKQINLPECMKCPKNAKDFIEYYSSRLRRKKEATLLYWVLKKAGLPRDLANLGRKAACKNKVK